MLGPSDNSGPDQRTPDRLALGTVQFGLPYGISNDTGQIDQFTAGALLERCRTLGVKMLDTAEDYGSAETLLGQHGVHGFDIVSKIGRLDVAIADVETQIRSRVQAIMRRLRTDHLYGLMLHAPDQLMESAQRTKVILDALDRLRSDGLVARIGVSTYDPALTGRLLDLFDFALVQLPLSPIDRRWDRCGMLDRLHRSGVELHVRSIYLQGLLLMPADTLPDWTVPWQGMLREYQNWCLETVGDVVSACVAQTVGRPQVNRIVVGVQTTQQLDAAVSALALQLPPLPEHLGTTDPALLEPLRWPKE